jgi:hypothetical protein
LILYKRDRNSKKDWGHIWWWTTVYSYCRWNIKHKELEKYNKYLEKDYITNDKFIEMINKWYNNKFERKYLREYKNLFKGNYLYNFIYWISQEKTFEYDYYFRYSEMIDNKSLKYILKSYKQNSNYLFSNIALWSYYQHNQKFNLSYKFYLKALSLDENNPWVLAKLAILYSSMWLWKKWLLKAEEIMQKVINLLPDIPWTNAWYGETLNMIWRYYEALNYFKKYEKLTKWKHRTFEPFMRKAESYIWLWDFKKARIELNKESQYYFWEWYRYIYNNLDKKLKKLWY